MGPSTSSEPHFGERSGLRRGCKGVHRRGAMNPGGTHDLRQLQGDVEPNCHHREVPSFAPPHEVGSRSARPRPTRHRCPAPRDTRTRAGLPPPDPASSAKHIANLGKDTTSRPLRTPALPASPKLGLASGTGAGHAEIQRRGSTSPAGARYLQRSPFWGSERDAAAGELRFSSGVR